MRVAATVAPLALVAAGCGGTAPNAVSRAITKTQRAGSYHYVDSTAFNGDATTVMSGDNSAFVSKAKSGPWRYVISGPTMYLTAKSSSARSQLRLSATTPWAAITFLDEPTIQHKGRMTTFAEGLGAARALSQSRNMRSIGPGLFAGMIDGRRVEVRITPSGYVGRVTTAYFPLDPKTKVTTTFTFSRWGLPVVATVPPAYLTVDRTQMYIAELSKLGGPS